MRMIPDERDLADRFRSKPFAIVGVNCDDNPQVAINAEKTQQISWRSFRESGGKRPSIMEQWKNEGLPTVYVIDDKGRIRNHWIGVPPEESLTSAIDRLLQTIR
jgi:peroxiredoxin